MQRRPSSHSAGNRYNARKRKRSSKATRQARQIADMHNAMVTHTEPELVGTLDGVQIYADTVFTGVEDKRMSELHSVNVPMTLTIGDVEVVVHTIGELLAEAEKIIQGIVDLRKKQGGGTPQS